VCDTIKPHNHHSTFPTRVVIVVSRTRTPIDEYEYRARARPDDNLVQSAHTCVTSRVGTRRLAREPVAQRAPKARQRSTTDISMMHAHATHARTTIATTHSRAHPRPSAQRQAVVVRAKNDIDRATGYIGKDNSGSGNIFAIEPRQLYTESPTSDKYAKKGLGGIGGLAVAAAVIGGVVFATTSLTGFEEANNEFANYNGQSVSYYETQFK